MWCYEMLPNVALVAFLIYRCSLVKQGKSKRLREIELEGGERMKRTLIGGFIMFGGLFITLTIILAATIYIPNMSSWSGSQLWYAIFGGEQYENDEVVQSLFLGFPFVIGILLSILGLVLLVMEYFETSFLKLIYIIKSNNVPK